MKLSFLLTFLLLTYSICGSLGAREEDNVERDRLARDNDRSQPDPDDQIPTSSSQPSQASHLQSSVSSDARVRQCDGIRPGTSRYHVGDGYFFHQQRCAGGRIYLRCVNYYTNPRCYMRAVMNPDHTNFLVTNGDRHNHAPDDHYERVIRLRESLLEACRVRPNVRVEIIYHDICRNVRRDVSSRVTLNSIRPSMVRAQNEHRPNIPDSFQVLAEVLSNDNGLGHTLDMEMELYQGLVGAEGHQSLVFMSRRLIDGIGNVHYLFGDGTFYARPRVPDSAQLFTLVATRDNHVIPLCYALMESRTAQAYRDLFQFIRNFAPNLDPDYVMSDFEVAQQHVLAEVFPRARHVGCLWHYARAVSRNVRVLGLHPLVRDNDNARRIARLCLAIPLAPANRLQEALNCIVVEARRLCIGDDFAVFFRYIQETWINGVGNALSVFGVRHRTNNVAECHHRNINARLVRRPNVWRFIEMVREMEDLAWRDLGRIEQGQAPSRARRVSSIMNDARVRSCSRQVMQREMEMLHFLSCVSHSLEAVLQDSIRERPGDDRPASPPRCLPVQRHSLDPVSAPLIPSNPRRARTLSPGRLHGSSRPGTLTSMPLDDDFEEEWVPVSQDADYVPRALDEDVIFNPSQVDDCDLFESLVENDAPANRRGRRAATGRPQGRGRGTRGGRGRARGRGRGSTGRGRNPQGQLDSPRAQPHGAPAPSSHADTLPDAATRDPVEHQDGPVMSFRVQPWRAAVPTCSLEDSSDHDVDDPIVVCDPPGLMAQPPRAAAENRPQNFSDAEEVDASSDPVQRRWTECIICNANVGRYTILGCGAYPVCGTCIRRWFIWGNNGPCLHCGAQVYGWLRLHFGH